MTLEWDRNPETNVTGYRVYVGRQSRVYDSVLDVANQTVATIAAPAGTSFYAVTAYNTDGLESDFSDEVSYAPPWTNSPPLALPDNYATTKNIPRVVSTAVGVLVNDVDVDPHPLSAVLVTLPVNGTVTLAANGSFIYTPRLDFVGQDWFGYSVSDGFLTSAVAVVTITVTEVPSSGSQGCTNCFTDLDALLAVRSVEMQSLIAARTSVPTNMTCPKLGVFIFGAVSRAARALNDVELNAVLASTAECLTWNFANELTEKVTAASSLLPSRWTATASNQALAASHLLAGISSSSNSLKQARLLANAAIVLQRLDRSIAAGALAPSSLGNLVAACRVSDGPRRIPVTFTFGDGTLTMQDPNGAMFTGVYTYTRTAWNTGTLVVQFDQNVLQLEPGQNAAITLKFGRLRHRMIGETLRGSFTLQQ